MLGWRCLTLALLGLLSPHAVVARFVSGDVDADLANDVVVKEHALSSRALSPSWWGIVRCAVAAQPLVCVDTRSQHAVDAILAQMTEARAADDDTALDPEVVDKVTELSETVVEAASAVLERRLGLGGVPAGLGADRGDEDGADQGQGLVEEGRGKKKKKKIHKLIALVKLVLLVLVVKLKLAFVMMALQTLFQFKLVVMVFLILLIKKVSLWAQLKHAKIGEAQKVVYYEHAQHQHHYDDHGDHGGGWNGGGGGGHEEHADGGGGGGWGGLWGRSYDTVQGMQGQAAGAAATLGVQSGVYKATDGSRIVVRQPDAHDVAYSAQRP